MNSKTWKLAVFGIAAMAPLLAVGVQPASASVSALVPVPANCGPYSGTLVPANTLDDHSNDSSPLGTTAVAYQVTAPGLITVGTRFGDHIQGSSGVDVICGLAKGDFILGGGGADEIYAGGGADTVFGEEAGDFVSGGPGLDFLYGDDETNSHTNFDGSDTLQGGSQSDELYGGSFGDTLNGGSGADFGDGDAGPDTCLAVEVEESCELP